MRVVAVSALAILSTVVVDATLLARPAEACGKPLVVTPRRPPNRARSGNRRNPIDTSDQRRELTPRNAGGRRPDPIDSGPRAPGPVPVKADEPVVTTPAPTASPVGAPTIEVEVYFASSSTSLGDSAMASLAPVVTWLQANPRGILVAIGHADAVGPAGANLALSRRRAAAVKRFLVERAGIQPNRIQVAARGETQLADPADEAKNRRVEIRQR